MYSSDEAKMTGTTPAMFTLIGMYVFVPPRVRRPTMRFAYCTGMRRCDCSTKTTRATTTMPTASTRRKTSKPRDVAMAHMAAGNCAAIEVKMRMDMPLPTPRSVTSSANHMMRPVPAVSVMIISSWAHHTSLVSSALHSAMPVVPKS